MSTWGSLVAAEGVNEVQTFFTRLGVSKKVSEKRFCNVVEDDVSESVLNRMLLQLNTGTSGTFRVKAKRLYHHMVKAGILCQAQPRKSGRFVKAASVDSDEQVMSTESEASDASEYEETEPSSAKRKPGRPPKPTPTEVVPPRLEDTQLVPDSPPMSTTASAKRPKPQHGRTRKFYGVNPNLTECREAYLRAIRDCEAQLQEMVQERKHIQQLLHEHVDNPAATTPQQFANLWQEMDDIVKPIHQMETMLAKNRVEDQLCFTRGPACLKCSVEHHQQTWLSGCEHQFCAQCVNAMVANHDSKCVVCGKKFEVVQSRVILK